MHTPTCVDTWPAPISRDGGTAAPTVVVRRGINACGRTARRPRGRWVELHQRGLVLGRARGRGAAAAATCCIIAIEEVLVLGAR